ncbi:MAG: sigma-70 family RNA polymerase sigma factor [Anaerolineales bacterium]|nr:sigma-70 family RNA polymerase sigma factor [Anaerolineales bacterium]
MTDTPEPTVASSLNPGLVLHQRLLAGDVTASAEIANAYLEPLIARLRARYGWLDDPHLPDEAAISALWNYLQNPRQYKPEERSLEAYLVMAAYGDLKNELTKRARERKFQGGSQVVELDAPGAEYRVGDDSELTVEEQVAILVSPVWAQLDELLPNPVDRKLVQLIMDNVGETAVFSEVLGISGLPSEEQERQVKRHKDRLKKQLRRHVRREEIDGE